MLADLPESVWLLLENTAGAGGTIGRTVDELAAVIERCPHPRLGVCLDSCHLFASGIEIGEPAAMTALLDELDAKVGLDRLRAPPPERLADAVRLEPRPARERRRGADRRGLGELPRASAAAGPALRARDAGRGDGKGVDAQCLAPARRLHEAGVALYS